MAGRLNFSSLCLHPPSLAFLFFAKQTHNPHLGRNTPFSPVGVHLGPFRLCVCAHMYASFCECEGSEGGWEFVGNERCGALSNSAPLLMAQLHHYLAHTLGSNRLREEGEGDRQVYQTKYEQRRGAIIIT